MLISGNLLYTIHVKLVVDVDAVGPEGGPQVVIDVPFPDVFFEQVVAGAALDLQEGFLALEPGEYRDEHGVRPPCGCAPPTGEPGSSGGNIGFGR